MGLPESHEIQRSEVEQSLAVSYKSANKPKVQINEVKSFQIPEYRQWLEDGNQKKANEAEERELWRKKDEELMKKIRAMEESNYRKQLNSMLYPISNILTFFRAGQLDR